MCSFGHLLGLCSNKPCVRCEKLTSSQCHSFVHSPVLFLLNIDENRFWANQMLQSRPHSLTAKSWMSLVCHPPLAQGDPPEIPEDLVHCWLCVIHPCGLHLLDGGQSRLRGLQDSQGAAHRPLHQNLEPASTAPPVQTHPLHPPVGGGEKLQESESRGCLRESRCSKLINMWNIMFLGRIQHPTVLFKILCRWAAKQDLLHIAQACWKWGYHKFYCGPPEFSSDIFLNNQENKMLCTMDSVKIKVRHVETFKNEMKWWNGNRPVKVHKTWIKTIKSKN